MVYQENQIHMHNVLVNETDNFSVNSRRGSHFHDLSLYQIQLHDVSINQLICLGISVQKQKKKEKKKKRYKSKVSTVLLHSIDLD